LTPSTLWLSRGLLADETGPTGRRIAGLRAASRRDQTDHWPLTSLDKWGRIGEYGGDWQAKKAWIMPQEDFDIDSLAVYLHLTPQQVTRLADRGKLPGRKVANQWRFSRAEIHHWLEHRIGLSDEVELVEVEDVLRRSAGTKPADVCIADLLPVEAIAVPLKARTRTSVIKRMVQLAADTGLLWDAPKMVEAVRAREDMHPTALESGVAMLHPRRPLTRILAQPFLALGRTASGIPFGGQAALTDIFFLVCSADDRGHLRTLARLSRVLAAPGFLDALRDVPDAMAARKLIAETEQQF
jgi:PTS system nitrogen regulatory IIA component